MDYDWNHLLFSFDGRINRGKWWVGGFTIWLLMVSFGLLTIAFESSVLTTIMLVLILGLLWPYLAVQIKRWHDRGKSGWWVLIALIPIIGNLWVIIECGFLIGDEGPNQYGPDPLES